MPAACASKRSGSTRRRRQSTIRRRRLMSRTILLCRTPTRRTPTRRVPTRRRTPTRHMPTRRTLTRRVPTRRVPTPRTPTRRVPTRRMRSNACQVDMVARWDAWCNPARCHSRARIVHAYTLDQPRDGYAKHLHSPRERGTGRAHGRMDWSIQAPMHLLELQGARRLWHPAWHCSAAGKRQSCHVRKQRICWPSSINGGIGS